MAKSSTRNKGGDERVGQIAFYNDLPVPQLSLVMKEKALHSPNVALPTASEKARKRSESRATAIQKWKPAAVLYAEDMVENALQLNLEASLPAAGTDKIVKKAVMEDAKKQWPSVEEAEQAKYLAREADDRARYDKDVEAWNAAHTEEERLIMNKAGYAARAPQKKAAKDNSVQVAEVKAKRKARDSAKYAKTPASLKEIGRQAKKALLKRGKKQGKEQDKYQSQSEGDDSSDDEGALSDDDAEAPAAQVSDEAQIPRNGSAAKPQKAGDSEDRGAADAEVQEAIKKTRKAPRKAVTSPAAKTVPGGKTLTASASNGANKAGTKTVRKPSGKRQLAKENEALPEASGKVSRKRDASELTAPSETAKTAPGVAQSPGKKARSSSRVAATPSRSAALSAEGFEGPYAFESDTPAVAVQEASAPEASPVQLAKATGKKRVSARPQQREAPRRTRAAA